MGYMLPVKGTTPWKLILLLGLSCYTAYPEEPHMVTVHTEAIFAVPRSHRLLIYIITVLF